MRALARSDVPASSLVKLRRRRGFPPRLLLAPLMIVALAALAGCGSQFGGQGGWSGVVAGEGLVFVGAQEGKLLALDSSLEALTPAERLRWSFSSDEKTPLGAVYGTPVVGDGRLYFGAYNGRVYSLETERGTTTARGTWEFATSGAVVGGVALAAELVLVGSSDGGVYALDREGGQEVWRFSAQDKIWSTPVVAGGLVYVGSLDKHLYAIRLDDGSEEWRFPAGGALVASPVVAGGKVYVGALDNRLYALDAATGQKAWEFPGGNWFWASPASDGRRVYAGNMDGFVYALDAETGREVWRFNAEAPVMVPPLLTETGLIVASDKGRLWFLNAEDGKRMAYRDQEGKERLAPSFFDVGASLRAPLTIADGVLYVHTMDRAVTALDPLRGIRQWSFDTKPE